MLHKVESKSPTVAAAFVPSEVLRNKLWDRRRFLHLCFGYQIPGFLPSHLINDSDHCFEKKKKRELKKLFSPQSLPPLRRKTHHVIEIFSSFFFKLDSSLHIPFFSAGESLLRSAVLLTLNDPEALVDCPGAWRAYGAFRIYNPRAGSLVSLTRCRCLNEESCQAKTIKEQGMKEWGCERENWWLLISR